MEFDREAAAKLLALLAPRRKNEKQKATQKKKLQGTAARQEAMKRLRAECMNRAAHVCELCEGPRAHLATELHHLEGGSGRRRSKQTIENCMAVCMNCHRTYHWSPASFAPLVKQWAERHGYPLPSIIRKAEASAELPGRAAR